ncbi:MAG: helix-turn-helix domain-containing protein [Patescibacteria group bacterium]
MAKSKERNKAIELRKKGKSIKKIAKILEVSKSSVSIWCADIKLTQKQVEKLHKNMVKGSYHGRMIGAKMQHAIRMKRVKNAEESSIKEIGKLSKRDLLIAIAALYWGEGSKKKREFFLINSDPEMIKFLMKVFRKLFKVKKDRFTLAVGINVIHKNRDEEIKGYWSKITKIPKDQFRKTIFIKAKNKKNYKNFKTYYGTLRINIKKSIDIYYKTMGLIKGLIKGI